MKTTKRFLIVLAFICITVGMKSNNTLAAPKKYVRSLSVSRKTISITAGKSKKISYKVRVKGKASKKVKIKASNTKVKAKVKSGKIVIFARKSGTSKITITTKGKNKRGKNIKSYIKVKIIKKEKPIEKPDPVVTPPIEVTKSEWISSIMEAAGYSVQKELFDYNENGKISYSFNDISNDVNADIIETAVKYGVIPSEDRIFQPNAAADREFAAMTAVRALGFAADEVNLNCSDRADLKYPAEDTLAVKLKILELLNGRFLPKKAITSAEKQNAEIILADIVERREIDKEHKNTIQYREDVKIVEDITNYEVSERNGIYTVIVSVGTSLDKVEEGDKILLPATKKYIEGIALCVSSNTLSLNKESRIIEGTVPENVEEFVDAMNIEGKVQVNTATAVEGVATVEVSKGDVTGGLKRASIDGEINLKDKTKFSYTIKMIETTFSFYLSELKYRVDFNRKGVKELYIGLPNVIELDTFYEAKKEFSGKIGDIPVPLAGGLSVNIEVYFEAEIGGKVQVNFKLSNEVGVQYYNGELLQIKRCTPDLNVTGEADADMGAKIQVGLYWMKGIQELFDKSSPKPLYNVYTKWGLHGNALLKLRNDKYTSFENLVCVDLSYYLYGNIGVGEDSILGDEFDLKKMWDIFDEKNSPVKNKLHIENGKIVSECTYQSPNVLFAKYIKQFNFLCDDEEIHQGYVCFDDKEGCFGWKTDINIKIHPFSYDIDDFDLDGDNELLIANADSFVGLSYGDSVIRLQMYEAKNGKIQLTSEKMCEGQVRHWWDNSVIGISAIPVYDTTAEGGTKLFKYKQNKEWVIALENNDYKNLFGDGLGVRFVAVKYNGEKFINVGEYWSSGSDYGREEIDDLRGKLAAMDISVDAEQISRRNKCIIDYIENPVIIGKSLSKVIVDESFDDEVFVKPNVWWKYTLVSFAHN